MKRCCPCATFNYGPGTLAEEAERMKHPKINEVHGADYPLGIRRVPDDPTIVITYRCPKCRRDNETHDCPYCKQEAIASAT